MIDPFTSWLRMMRSATLFAEMLNASGHVIRHRSGTIRDAVADPGTADLAELQLMVSEKAVGFTAAGEALARDWWKLQADWIAQWTAVGKLMTSGRLPTPRSTRAIAARSRRLGDGAVTTATRALRPIHAAATANARRLRKR